MVAGVQGLSGGSGIDDFVNKCAIYLFICGDFKSRRRATIGLISFCK